MISCGCNKDMDGIDTDVFKLFPKELMSKVNKMIGLDTSEYNDDVKNNDNPERDFFFS